MTTIFLDAEKSFDQTWHNGLNFKLDSLNIPPKMFKIISSFLNDRKMKLFYRNIYSDAIDSKAGTVHTPQGSILSPLLYITHVNDIPTCRKTTLTLPNSPMTLLYGMYTYFQK